MALNPLWPDSSVRYGIGVTGKNLMMPIVSISRKNEYKVEAKELYFAGEGRVGRKRRIRSWIIASHSFLGWIMIWWNRG